MSIMSICHNLIINVYMNVSKNDNNNIVFGFFCVLLILIKKYTHFNVDIHVYSLQVTDVKVSMRISVFK